MLKNSRLNGKDLSVAILIDDFDERLKISHILQEIDASPHLYDSLHSFWIASIKKMPRLCIVDVKKMSEGEYILKDHPSIKNHHMPLVFYYTKETVPLLISTYNIFHIGRLQCSLQYRVDIKIILKRLNKFEQLEDEIFGEKLKRSQSYLKIAELKSCNEKYKKQAYYLEILKGQIVEIEGRQEEEDFFNNILKTFESFEGVEAFSYLELDESMTGVISRESTSSKVKQIPFLSSKKILKDGIDEEFQVMITENLITYLGDRPISLRVTGGLKKPEVLIFLKIKDRDLLENFNFHLFEKLISGVYKYSHLRSQKNTDDIDFLSPWEFLSLLDHHPDEQSQQLDILNLVEINFTAMIKIIMQRQERQFYWKHFLKNFFGQIVKETDGNCKMINWGVDRLYLLIVGENFDSTYEKIGIFVSNYSPWRSLEKMDVPLTSDFTPTVKRMPFSSLAILEYLTKGEQMKTREGDDHSWFVDKKSSSMNL